MAYPAKYPPAVNEPNWNAMVDRVNGVTLAGVRSYPYSFQVRDNGGVYEAIDTFADLTYGGSADDGGIDGDSAAAVINAAIAAVFAAGGGEVKIKKATSNYSISTPIVPKHRVDIILEREACLEASVNLNPAIFNFENVAATTYLTKVSGGRISGGNVCNSAFSFLDAVKNIFIEDMEVGSCVSSPFLLHGAWGLKFRNVAVTAPSGAYCFDLERAVAAHTGNHLNTWENVTMWNSGAGNQMGVRIKGDAYGDSFKRCFFSGTGMHIVGDGTYIPTLTDIDSCWFERDALGVANEYAIKITDIGGHTTIPRGTTIKNPHVGLYDFGVWLEYAQNTTIHDFYGSGQNTADIYCDTNATDTTVYDGIYTSAAKAIVTNSPVRLRTRGAGWENQGMATGVTGIVQPHSLYGTPTTVLLAAEGNTPYKVSADYGGANITIYHDKGVAGSVWWYANYVP